MTATNESTRTLQTSDGVSLTYAFDFEIQGITDAEFQDQVLVYENGVLTVKSYTIHTVTSAGGTVDFTIGGIPPDVGDLAIVRNKRNTQESALPTLNPYPTVERQLDDLTLQVQDVEAIGEFGIRQPEWEQKRIMQLPSINNRALRVVAFDQDGNVDVSDLLAVPVQFIDCTVSINAEPYNADPTGVTDSTAGILAALASGATRIVGCPGRYWVDYTVFESNCVVDLPGVEFFNPAPSEGNGVSFGNNANITTENCHVTIDKLTGYDYVQANNYRNCSLKQCLIDGVADGLRVGAWLATTGVADNFVADRVVIQNAVRAAITPVLGTNKQANIDFRNVSVIDSTTIGGTHLITLDNFNGSWVGGNIKNNVPTADTMYFTNVRGFDLSGVTFDHNGNFAKTSREIHLAGNATGLNITGNKMTNQGATNGRQSVIYGGGSTMNGVHIAGNYISMNVIDNAACVGITLNAGAINNFVAANNIGITGVQTRYDVDVLTNYLIVDGVKQ